MNFPVPPPGDQSPQYGQQPIYPMTYLPVPVPVYVRPQPVSGFAVTSFAVGLIALLLLSFFWFVWWLTAAMAMGAIAMGIGGLDGHPRGLAIAGIVLGALAFVTSAIGGFIFFAILG